MTEWCSGNGGVMKCSDNSRVLWEGSAKTKKKVMKWCYSDGCGDIVLW